MRSVTVCLIVFVTLSPVLAEEEIQLPGCSVDLGAMLRTVRPELSATDEPPRTAPPVVPRPLTADQQRVVDQVRANIRHRVSEAKALAEKNPAYRAQYQNLQAAHDRLMRAEFRFSPHATSDSSDYAYVAATSSSTVYLTPKFFDPGAAAIGYVPNDPDIANTARKNAEASFSQTVSCEGVLIHESVHLDQAGLSALLPWNWGFFYQQKERSAYETELVYLRLYGAWTDGTRFNEQLNNTLGELEWYANTFGVVGNTIDQFNLLMGLTAATDRATFDKILAIARDRCQFFSWKYGAQSLPPELLERMFNEHLERERVRAGLASPAVPPPASGPAGPPADFGGSYWRERLRHEKIDLRSPNRR